MIVKVSELYVPNYCFSFEIIISHFCGVHGHQLLEDILLSSCYISSTDIYKVTMQVVIDPVKMIDFAWNGIE